MNPLFSRKTIAQLQAEATEQEAGLHRALSAFNLTTLGVGAIIGAGIFVLTGVAAAKYAGPAVVLSFTLGGIACAFAGLCYAEMASTVPIAGSAYTYAYATMGELFAWIIGWDLCLEYAFGATTVAIGWSGYVVSFLRNIGLALPPEITQAPGTKIVQIDGAWHALNEELARHILHVPAGQAAPADLMDRAFDSLPHATGLLNLPAVFVVAAVTTLLVVGIKESANVTSAIVVVKVIVVLAFLGACAPLIVKANWHPFLPPNTGEFGHYGVSGILRGAGVVFFAYIGFDAVSTAAQEAKKPQRDMPIGILGSPPHLHDPLHPRRRRHHRDRPLHRARRSGSHRPRRRPGGARVARAYREDRRHLRAHLRHPRHDDGAAADLLLDGQRRAPAANRREGAPALSDAVRHDDRDGRARGDHRGDVADRRRGGAREHRDAPGVRARVRRCAGAAGSWIRRRTGRSGRPRVGGIARSGCSRLSRSWRGCPSIRGCGSSCGWPWGWRFTSGTARSTASSGRGSRGRRRRRQRKP